MKDVTGFEYKKSPGSGLRLKNLKVPSFKAFKVSFEANLSETDRPIKRRRRKMSDSIKFRKLDSAFQGSNFLQYPDSIL